MQYQFRGVCWLVLASSWVVARSPLSTDSFEKVGSFLSPSSMIFLHIKPGEEKFQSNWWLMRSAPPITVRVSRWGFSFGSHGEGLLLLRRFFPGSSPKPDSKVVYFRIRWEEVPRLFGPQTFHSLNINFCSTFQFSRKIFTIVQREKTKLQWQHFFKDSEQYIQKGTIEKT